MSNFSVLIPVYRADHPGHFQLALESIFESSVLPGEVVIVEDGPLTTELNDVVEGALAAHKNTIKVVKLAQNQGLGRALSEGLKACSYELVARMDADDLCCPERFRKQLEIFEKDKTVAIVGANIDEYDEEMTTYIGTRNVPETNVAIKKFSKKRNPFNHMSVIFKKSAVQAAGGYIHQKYFEDYYLWCRLLQKYNGYNVQDSLVKVRGGTAMYKRRGGLSYAKDIADFQRAIRKIGYISRLEECLNIATRVPVAVAPACLKKLVYEKLLRGQS